MRRLALGLVLAVAGVTSLAMPSTASAHCHGGGYGGGYYGGRGYYGAGYGAGYGGGYYGGYAPTVPYGGYYAPVPPPVVYAPPVAPYRGVYVGRRHFNIGFGY